MKGADPLGYKKELSPHINFSSELLTSSLASTFGRRSGTRSCSFTISSSTPFSRPKHLRNFAILTANFTSPLDFSLK